jgi:putative acetyltransferase
MTDIRPEKPADLPGIRALLAAAFCGDAGDSGAVPVEVGLVDALRGGDSWLSDLSVVADSAGIIGYALLSRVTAAGVPALALGPVAVRPDRQREGVGTLVVRGALDRAAAAGERLVLVLGAPAFYSRFGFRPGAAYGLTGTWSSFGDVWQALVLPGAPAPEPGEVHHPAPWHEL